MAALEDVLGTKTKNEKENQNPFLRAIAKWKTESIKWIWIPILSRRGKLNNENESPISFFFYSAKKNENEIWISFFY